MCRNEESCAIWGVAPPPESFFGALNYLTGEFFIKSYPTADGKNTIKFIEWLREKQLKARNILIWDSASYHKYGKFRDYLIEQNKELMEENWAITCVNFATYAPQENPVEDIWLQRWGVAPSQKLDQKILL